MCEEAVVDCIAALKFIPDWFIPNIYASKMTKKLYTALYADVGLLFLFSYFCMSDDEKKEIDSIFTE